MTDGPIDETDEFDSVEGGDPDTGTEPQEPWIDEEDDTDVIDLEDDDDGEDTVELTDEELAEIDRLEQEG